MFGKAVPCSSEAYAHLAEFWAWQVLSFNSWHSHFATLLVQLISQTLRLSVLALSLWCLQVSLLLFHSMPAKTIVYRSCVISLFFHVRCWLGMSVGRLCPLSFLAPTAAKVVSQGRGTLWAALFPILGWLSERNQASNAFLFAKIKKKRAEMKIMNELYRRERAMEGVDEA